MQANYTLKVKRLFWGRIDKKSSHKSYLGTRCWEWSGYRMPKGYGQVGINGKVYLTHRVAYEIELGEIPEDLQVLHKCDNPPCCNPAHLFLGTNGDNRADMVQKGRQSSGEKHWNHKLTNAQVDEIRQRYSKWGIGGEHSTALSKEFGVTARTIRHIVNHELWS